MEEKEFEPSKMKLKKARLEGNVASSSELALGLLMLFFFLLLYLVSPLLYERLKTLFSFTIMNQQNPLDEIKPLFLPLGIILGALTLFSYLVHVMQIGFVWSWPKKKRGSKRFLFPLLKLVGILALFTLIFKTTTLPTLKTKEQLTLFLIRKLWFTAFLISLYLVILGIGDFIYQKWLYMKKMRMTRVEKEEEERH